MANEQWVTIPSWMTWMLRIVHLPTALTQRGCNSAVEGTLHLEITDTCLDANAGRWEVHFSGGGTNVQRGGDGRLKMDVRALAPLFTGYFSAGQLVRTGMVESSDPQQVQLAERP